MNIDEQLVALGFVATFMLLLLITWNTSVMVNECTDVCRDRQMKFEDYEMTGTFIKHAFQCGCYYFKNNERIVRWFEVGEGEWK